MEYIQGLYPIIKKRTLAKETYDLTVHCPAIVEYAKPGQFVHIRVQGFTLRRPISICEVDYIADTLRLVFEIRGEGTKAIAALPEGGCIDLLAPLGKGFSMLPEDSKAIVVGGGIGVPPMLETVKQYKNATAILGFRSADAVMLTDDFAAWGCDVRLSTDDGSRGHKGFVTDLLKKRLEEDNADIIYACGPMAMLKNVAAMAKEAGVRCEVSLEERMGCGVGACLVCACKMKREDGSETFKHVCKDGPVFRAEEVVW